MDFKEGHWYKFEEAVSGCIFIGRYDGTNSENDCVLCDKDSYSAHHFSIYYKQNGELIKDGLDYCNKHLPRILEDLGESDKPFIHADLDN